MAPLTNGKNNNFTQYRTSKPIDFTADRFGGYQYKSFEAQKSNYNNKSYSNNNNNKIGGGGGGGSRRNFVPRPIKLNDYEVIEAPLDLSTDDYIIDSKNIVCFNGTEHFLSGFYSSPIKIDDHEYKSVEHYYQACKLYSLAGSQHALQLRNINEATKVKAVAKRILLSLNITKESIDQWKSTHGFIMLHHAMVHKYVQNIELREKLLATDDAILAHSYDRDSFYACGMKKEDLEKWAKENEGKVVKIPSELSFENVKYIPLIGKGKNIEGAMAMKIRKQMAALARENREISVDPFLPSILNSLSISGGGGGTNNSEDNTSSIPSQIGLVMVEKQDNSSAIKLNENSAEFA